MAFVDTSLEEDDESELPAEKEGDLETEVSVEDRARAMGWKPLPADPHNPTRDEYRGDPRLHRSADEFIAHGEREWPVLRESNRRMSEKLARLEPEVGTLRNTIAEQKEAIAAAMTLARRADQRGYDRAVTELKEQRRAAVEAGDVEAHDQVQEQIDTMERERAKAEEPAAPTPTPEPTPEPKRPIPEIEAFIQANPWFNDARRPYLQTAMIGMHNAVIAEKRIGPLADQLAEALERLQAAYPEIAPAAAETDEDEMPQPPAPRPARRAPSALPPSAPMGQRRAAVSPIDRIADTAERAQARQAFLSMKRQDPDFTEGEYMALYDDPHADALELRRQRKK